MATQGLSNYLLKQYPNQQVKVVIAHDSRNNSTKFARLTAEVFSANGIHVYYFEGLRPTPELSYAIRHLGCQSGVMLTASHNPREYNGYKAYGEDGGQLVSPADTDVISEVRNIASVDDIKFTPNSDLIQSIGKEIDEAYLDQLVKLTISPESIANQKDLKIVFSPIHGTGGVLVPPILKKFGFENVILVDDQMEPNGDFPTVVYPNPEEQEAMTLSLQRAKEVDADLVMATDPDADRVGIGVKNDQGDFILLNGNQTACLLFDYVLSAYERQGKLSDRHYIIKTIVSSYLLDKIAEQNGVTCYNTLTGFKYIGELMTQFEGEKEFLVGGEESYGYLVGEHARDKDAVISCAMLAEMAAYHKDNGSSVYDALIQLYIKYGFFKEKLIALTKKGKSGAEEIQALLHNLRTAPPKTLGGSRIAKIKDYQTGKSLNTLTGDTETINLPSSNVLQFFTEDGSIVSARPSGTEPKIKFYCSVNTSLDSKLDFDKKNEELELKLDSFLQDMGAV